MLKIICPVLCLVFLSLQYRLWIGEGSLAHAHRLQSQIDEQSRINDSLQAENDLLVEDVKAYKNGYGAIEARARKQMGLIRKGETFYMFVDESEHPN